MSCLRLTDKQTDEQWMHQALKQGESVKGQTGENPHVGCVIVKDNTLIASGATQPPGKAHAEVHAIENAHSYHHCLQGSVFYCTLEPCCFLAEPHLAHKRSFRSSPNVSSLPYLTPTQKSKVTESKYSKMQELTSQ